MWSLHDLSCAGPDDCSCKRPILSAPKPTPALKEPRTLKQSVHRIPERVRRDTLALFGPTCLWCKEPGGSVDLHHVQRRSQGGKDVPVNLRPVHRKCHRFIHDNPAVAKYAGFLA